MKILGLNCSYNSLNHDPSACLMINGKLIDSEVRNYFTISSKKKSLDIQLYLGDQLLREMSSNYKKAKTYYKGRL